MRQALIVVWEAADRICGKRLKAALPHLVESMERNGQPGSGPSGASTTAVGHQDNGGPPGSDSGGNSLPRKLAGNPDSPQAVIFLASITDVMMGS